MEGVQLQINGLAISAGPHTQATDEHERNG
jgi:hypothetical protein